MSSGANFRVGALDCCHDGDLGTCCLSALGFGFALNYLATDKMHYHDQGKEGGVGFLDHPLGMGVLSLLCPWAGAICMRMRVRKFFDMEEDHVDDILCGLCCTPCVNCQTYNEVKERGL